MAPGSASAGQRWPRRIAFALYRLLWVAAFVGAIVTVCYDNFVSELRTQARQKAGMALGFSAYLNGSAEGLLLGPFGEEGVRLGFRNGDLLVAIGGTPVPAEPDAKVAALAGLPGRPVDLTIRHETGAVEVIRVVRDPGRSGRGYAWWGITYDVRRWAAFTVLQVAVIASLLAALLLFLRRPRDKVAQLLSFSLVLSWSPGFEWQFDFAQALLTLAVLLFPSGGLRTAWPWVALAAAVASVALNWFFSGAVGTAGWSRLSYAVAATFLLIAVMQKLRRTPAGIARQQVKPVLFGIVAYCVLTVSQAALVQSQLVVVDKALDSWVVLLSHLAMALSLLAIPAGLLVSLLRFRLYDAETAISRSVVVGTLTVALLAIFAGSEKVIETLGQAYLGGLGAWSGALGAGVAAALTVPLHHAVSRWAERRFQGNLVRLRKDLPSLVADLREIAEPAAIGEATLARVAFGARAVGGAMVTGTAVIATRDVEPEIVDRWADRWQPPDDRFDRLDVDQADGTFPVRVPLYADGVGLVGWLLLGSRPDGSLYGRDERAVLLEIADPVARALAIASRRHEREAERDRGIDRLRGRLAEMERLFAEMVGTRASTSGAFG